MPRPTITKQQATKQRPTVADYIANQIVMCGKSQIEIAEQVGFEKPNVITMIKQGKTKLPLAKVGRMAKALEVDPVFLLEMVMREYQPETWNEIASIFKQPVLTANELEIIAAIRESKVQNPKLRTPEERKRVIDAINTLKPDNAVND